MTQHAVAPGRLSDWSLQGRRWGARARDWERLVAGFSAPAWHAVAAAAGVGAGTRVLDVGCGSGEFCQLAAARGAPVAGLDAAAAMIDLARLRVPTAQLVVGDMQRLPWRADSFDLVTAFGAIQYASHPHLALREAKRVTRRGGLIALCGWGLISDNDLQAVVGAVRALLPARARPAAPAPADHRAPLETLACGAGIVPVCSGAVDVPFLVRDERMLQRALLSPGPVNAVLERVEESSVREAILVAAARCRQADGSYRLCNRFDYLIACVLES